MLSRSLHSGYHLGCALVGVIEVMFATAGPIAIAMLLGSGTIDSGSIMQRWLLALPIAGLGVALGNAVAKHINQALMRRLMAGLLVFSGLMLARRFLVESFNLL